MNSRIEATKLEPEIIFEKNIYEIKADNMKIITSLDMNLSPITSNTHSLSYEHLNYNIMPQIFLQSPGKSPLFIKHFLSIHLKLNILIKIINGWLLLEHHFIYPFFGQNFANTSQQTSIDVQRRKHLKRQLTFSIQKLFIHQKYQYQMSNLNEPQDCIMCFTTIMLGKTLRPNANIQTNKR